MHNILNRILPFLYFASVLLLAFEAFLVQSHAQDDIIRINTDLVTVPTTVLDADGRYITNLKKEDFQIFEDGIEQKIALFEPVEQSFTILLLLDRSDSMSGIYRAELTKAANSFIKQLRPDDQLLVATFANGFDMLSKPAKVRDLREEIKIKKHSGDNGTIIYDAVEIGLKKLKKISGRKALVLFSDGDGSGYNASAEENYRDAEKESIVVYTVQFETFSSLPKEYADSEEGRKSVATANRYMRDLAEKTGGRSYRMKDILDLEMTFSIIAGELGGQYSLGYYPAQTETDRKQQVRQIEVRVRQPNLVVRARETYIAEKLKTKQK